MHHRHPKARICRILRFAILQITLTASISAPALASEHDVTAGIATDTATTDTATTDIATPGSRPKIGLVLSGGGARGFAHIGALKVLEQHNIPIDYIAGTSMGSIIGGLYATGMKPEEIEQGVRGIDWANVFKDIPDRDYKYYRRKQDSRDFFNLHRVGMNEDGFQITPGLIEGQQIEIALDRLAHPGFHIRDFDQLHIPYRAIATDIETGLPLVIDSGNLARAMRASMSIPGALPPIVIDGHLLVDGGIANNVPIDVVREMGADIVIVVDVSAPLDDKEQLRSSIDVTGQLTTILTRRIADEQIATLQPDDVLIVPMEREITSSDFIEYETLIAEGHRAAYMQISQLKRLSLPDPDYARYQNSLPDIVKRNPVIDHIEVINHTPLRDEVLLARINQEIGEPLDVPQLEDDLAYIYGLDYSSSVVYDVEPRGEGHALIVYVRDREWAKSHLEFGLSIETTFETSSVSNFSTSFTNNRLNELGGEVRGVLSVGSEPKLTGEYYQPLNSNLDTFFSISGGADTTVFPIRIDDHIESIQRKNSEFIRVSMGQVLTHNTAFSLGIGHTSGKFESVAGLEAIEPEYEEAYYFIRLTHDSLDNLSFPNRGLFSVIEVDHMRQDIGADLDYEQVRANIGGATSFGRYTVFARAVAETTSDEEKLKLNGHLINGGFFELSGTIRNELISPHFGLIETAFYRRLGDITFLPIYTGFSLEAGNAWQRKDDISTDDLRYAGSLFIGADTFMGPLYFAYGHTDQGENAVYLYLGSSFLLD